MFSLTRQLWLISLIFLVFANPASAQVKLSDVEVFSRCYFKLLKSVVPRTPSLGKTLADDVFSKKLSGPQACAMVLDQTEFMDNGTNAGPSSTVLPRFSESENIQIISNLHNVHSSWFTKKALSYGSERLATDTQVLRDNDEPSLYFTRALFADKIPLSSVLTSDKSLRGVRITPDKSATTRWQSKPMLISNESLYGSTLGFLLSYGPASMLGSITIPDQNIVGFGRLVGVEFPATQIVPSVISPALKFDAAAFATSAQLNAANAQMNAAVLEKTKNVNLFEHFGGGILGSQVFIMKNTNVSSDRITPGVKNLKEDLIHRRASLRIFENLLCHQMPTLSEADVIGEVVADSPHGFRKSTSCMACHTSMDPVAHLYRNILPYLTSLNTEAPATPEGDLMRKKGTAVLGLTTLPEVMASEVFSLQKPTGTLNYRDHMNNLIQRPVASISDLGIALSTGDDFYRCTAKKYYSYLTGFEVNLTARNVAESNNTTTAQYHRKKVYELAANLKKHQSLKTLIKEIMSSEAFTYRNYEGL